MRYAGSSPSIEACSEHSLQQTLNSSSDSLQSDAFYAIEQKHFEEFFKIPNHPLKSLWHERLDLRVFWGRLLSDFLSNDSCTFSFAPKTFLSSPPELLLDFLLSSIIKPSDTSPQREWTIHKDGVCLMLKYQSSDSSAPWQGLGDPPKPLFTFGFCFEEPDLGGFKPTKHLNNFHPCATMNVQHNAQCDRWSVTKITHSPEVIFLSEQPTQQHIQNLAKDIVASFNKNFMALCALREQSYDPSTLAITTQEMTLDRCASSLLNGWPANTYWRAATHNKDLSPLFWATFSDVNMSSLLWPTPKMTHNNEYSDALNTPIKLIRLVCDESSSSQTLNPLEQKSADPIQSNVQSNPVCDVVESPNLMPFTIHHWAHARIIDSAETTYAEFGLTDPELIASVERILYENFNMALVEHLGVVELWLKETPFTTLLVEQCQSFLESRALDRLLCEAPEKQKPNPSTVQPFLIRRKL